jgi:hypothetical protein
MAGNFYDNVQQILRKTVELFPENGSTERETGSERLNKRIPKVIDNAR